MTDEPPGAPDPASMPEADDEETHAPEEAPEEPEVEPGPFRFPWETAAAANPRPAIIAASPYPVDTNLQDSIKSLYGLGAPRKKRHWGIKIGAGCCLGSVLFVAGIIVLSLAIFQDYKKSAIASFPVYSGSRQIAFDVGTSGSTPVETAAWASTAKLTTVERWYQNNLSAHDWKITSMVTSSEWTFKGINGQTGTGDITFSQSGALTEYTVELGGTN